MKKISLGIGTAIAVATPIVTVVACGGQAVVSPEVRRHNISLAENEQISVNSLLSNQGHVRTMLADSYVQAGTPLTMRTAEHLGLGSYSWYQKMNNGYKYTYSGNGNGIFISVAYRGSTADSVLPSQISVSYRAPELAPTENEAAATITERMIRHAILGTTVPSNHVLPTKDIVFKNSEADS